MTAVLIIKNRVVAHKDVSTTKKLKNFILRTVREVLPITGLQLDTKCGLVITELAKVGTFSVSEHIVIQLLRKPR